MKKILCKMLILFVAVSVLISSNDVYAIDFNGAQRSTYRLSNGRQVRIEYHGGEPHYHELDSKGNDLGSENLNNNNAHHSNGKKPSKSTRDIVKGKKQKSSNDKKAKKKADELAKEWKKAESNAKKASKKFVKKNKSNIRKATKKNKVVVVIGGIVYVVWWLLKLASGWGILI